VISKTTPQSLPLVVVGTDGEGADGEGDVRDWLPPPHADISMVKARAVIAAHVRVLVMTQPPTALEGVAFAARLRKADLILCGRCELRHTETVLCPSARLTPSTIVENAYVL
jgi:hypothetical protein